MAVLVVTGLSLIGGGSGPRVAPEDIGVSSTPSQAAPPGLSPDPQLAEPRVDPKPRETTSPSGIEQPEPSIPVGPTAREIAQGTFDSMTPEERVGQLIMCGVFASRSRAGVEKLVEQRHIGAVLLLGDWKSAADLREYNDHLQDLAGQWPLFVAADQEGGKVQHLTGPGFDEMPSALEQGQMEVSQLALAASGWGRELLEAGVNLNLAPVADVVSLPDPEDNAPIGRLERSFGGPGEDDLVGSRAVAFTLGMANAGVGSAVKHFPGLGGVEDNTDLSNQHITDTTTTADGPELRAFAQVMAVPPTMVMVSHAVYHQLDPAGPATFSEAIITDLLRGQMGWQGVVISDSFAAAAVASVPVAQRAVQFVAAGGDIAVYTMADQASAALDGLLTRAVADPEFQELVDQAVLRVLMAKAELGLLAG